MMNRPANRTNRIVQLNNDYVNRQTQRAKRRAVDELTKRSSRRYLGVILIAVMLVLSLPIFGLIESYQNLQKQQEINHQTAASSAALDSLAQSDQAVIKNYKNNTYIEKYARSQYSYSKSGETLFSTPSSSTLPSSIGPTGQ